MKRTALLIIDVQEAMFSSTKWKAYNEENLQENIRELSCEARENDVPIIYIQHSAEEGDFQLKTKGWEISKKICPMDKDYKITKTECDSFYKTDLKKLLDDLGIERLIICGMQTEYCVDTTCRNAFSKGYELTIVSDCHSTFDSDILKAEQIIAHHNKIFDSFGTVVKHDNVKFK